jgi:Lipase C-terminal domain/Lipase (class 2)
MPPVRLAGVALAIAGALLFAPAAGAQSFNQNPVLFVHGIEGSGAQFESQKMRFMSNGYPERWIDAVDYDSTRAVGDKSEVDAQIDQKIAALKQRTGRSQVDVVAHSLGTSVMYDYLTNGGMAAGRRANVGHYINVDGQASNPGVPTLAVWAGRGTPGRKMDGAQNVTIPNQTHVQTCTSAQSFVEYYKFLTGKAPKNDIVPQAGTVNIAGRTLVFPQNKGLPTTTGLEVWPVDTDTGRRTSSTPTAKVPLDSSGDFGPIRVKTGQRYEFVLTRPNVASLHYYYEPFIHDDYLLRLPYSDAIESAVQRSERHVAGLVIRYKELWGDQPGQSDVLSMNGTNVCVPAICPASHQVNGLFYSDRGADGRTDLSSPDPAFNALPFLTGADVFMAAARPPNSTIKVSLRSRGAGPIRTLSYPNFPSTTDGAVLQFNDFDTPVAGAGAAGASARCLPRRLAVSARRIGPARLRGSYKAFARRYRAVRRRHGVTRFCVRGGGRFLVASRKGKIDFVATTARGHKTRRRGPGSRLARRGMMVGRRHGSGRVIYVVRRGRVRFLAVVPARQGSKATKRRLRAAGLTR